MTGTQTVAAPGRIGSAVTRAKAFLTGSPEHVAPQQQDSITPKPTKQEVITCIAAAYPQYSVVDVAGMIDWLEWKFGEARQYNEDTFHPNDAEMRTTAYDVMDTVLPHGQLPTPGSPHDVLSRYIVDPSLGETVLVHDQTRAGRRVDCSVTVSSRSVN